MAWIHDPQEGRWWDDGVGLRRLVVEPHLRPRHLARLLQHPDRAGRLDASWRLAIKR